jgi:hypothetical protein
MASNLASRVNRLEDKLGADDMERYVRSLSDDELGAQIAMLEVRIYAMADAAGIDRSGMTSMQVAERLEELERSSHGNEINQGKSA